MLKALAGLALLLLASVSPALAQQSIVVPATMASVPINISTATTTQLVAGIAGKSIYVTQWNAVAGGTGNITFEYGTGVACGTGTTVLTGAYNLIAQVGAVVGVGNGAVLVVPSGASLCILSSAAVQISGSLAYAIF